MKVISRLLIVAAALAVAVVSATSPAGAVCLIAFQFNQNDGTGIYHYITQAGAVLPNVAGVTASYWALAGGVPAHPGGIDNGSLAPTNADVPWLRNNPTGDYLNGFWSDDLFVPPVPVSIDGCINDQVTVPAGTQKMVVQICRADVILAVERSFAAVACATKFADSNYYFGAVGGGANIDLKEIPKPLIATSSRAGGVCSVTFAPPVLPAFATTDTGCTGAALVTGTKIYRRCVPNVPGTPPSGRDRALWTDLGSVAGDSTPTGATDCYYARGLTFESGFQTLCVSANSTKVACDPTVADRPGGFKIVPKPGRKTTPQSHQQ